MGIFLALKDSFPVIYEIIQQYYQYIQATEAQIGKLWLENQDAILYI